MHPLPQRGVPIFPGTLILYRRRFAGIVVQASSLHSGRGRFSGAGAPTGIAAAAAAV
jgi:hypothetical protein